MRKESRRKTCLQLRIANWMCGFLRLHVDVIFSHKWIFSCDQLVYVNDLKIRMDKNLIEFFEHVALEA